MMKVAVIGFGNVGFQLSKKLLEVGEKVNYIYNRSSIDKPAFLQNSDLRISGDLSEIPAETDLCILTVADDAVQSVSNQLPEHIKNASVVTHTSGIYGLEELHDSIRHKAVIYPLNSFSKDTNINWAETPVFITAGDKDAEKLKSLVSKMSEQIYLVDSRQKALLHACAVMVNNFPNALFRMAANILEEHDLDLQPLLPLIKTTAHKVQQIHPLEAQTGPASRNDRKTVEKHMEILSDYPFEKQVYQLLSHYINPKLKKYEGD